MIFVMACESSSGSFDYKELNLSGKIRPVDNPLLAEEPNIDQSSQIKMATPELVIETTIAIEEVEDLIDENPVHYNTSNLQVIEKLCTLRNSLRRKDIQLKDENQLHLADSIKMSLANSKDYIKSAKDCKVKDNLAETKKAEEAAAFKKQKHCIQFTIKTSNTRWKNLRQIFARRLMIWMVKR